MKKILSIVLICTVLFTVPVRGEEGEALSISAPSAILMEAETGEILYEKNSHESRPPASVTKIMTMLLVIEAVDNGLISMDDMVTCSENAASMGGSQVYLEPGEQMSVHDMLKAVAVASGNDAAVALAEHIAGSMEGFVSMMNARAKELSMTDTQFINCNGLDVEGHVTSAHDIALMSRELLKHEKILEFTTIWMDSLRDGAFGLVNTNKLIRFYEGANGLKTGSTSLAKYCLSASAKRDDMTLIAVIMAAETSKDRFSDASKLLDYGFATYTMAHELMKEEAIPPVTVEKGEKTQISCGISDGFRLLIKKSEKNAIESKVTMPDTLRAPIREGDVIGSVEFSTGGRVLGTTDIVAKETAERQSPWGMLTKLSRFLLFGQ